MKFEEWVEVGYMLKNLRSKLRNYDFKGISKASRRKHPVTKALKHLDRLRDKLDDVVFMEHQDHDFHEKVHVFYGEEETK